MQVSQIATTAQQQTATTDEISRNITEITTVVQETVKDAQTSAQEAKKLSNLASDLQQLVTRFTL
jgi:methyl-accepting chemotaxis protein